MAIDKKAIAGMSMEDIFHLAETNISIAEVFHELEAKVKAYTKAIEYLDYIVKTFPEEAGEKNAKELAAKMRFDKDNAVAGIISDTFKEARAEFEKATSIDEYEAAKDKFERVQSQKKKYITEKKKITDDLWADVLECDKASDYVKACKEKVKLLKKKAKQRLLVTGVVLAVLLVGGFIFSKTPDYDYLIARMELKMDMTKKAEARLKELDKNYDNARYHEAFLECRYQEAVDYMEAGKRKEAYDVLKVAANEDYKDSKDFLYKIEKESIRNREIGDGSHFGKYYWYIVERTETECILVCEKDIPDLYVFDQEANGWEESDVREYLNHEFLEECFSERERADIEVSTVTLEGNDEYQIADGGEVEDLVYILSKSELEEYFDYLKEHSGAMWLRNPGASENLQAFSAGNIAKMYGYQAKEQAFGIRPVIKVKLEDSL